MSGFLAASFMRGIDFVQFPTSLVAHVDSAIGGKTGIDLPEGKNLVGAFKQPKAVMVDVDCLQTLPPRQLSCGLAEVIKYGVILDADFFEFLEAHVNEMLAAEPATFSKIIQRSCELKAQVVLADEHDTSGQRAILNYGHTFGHAIEALQSYTGMTHGEAIAIGMMMAVDLMVAQEGDDELKDLQKRQEALFKAVNLPVRVSGLEAEAILKAMQTDKKYEDGQCHLVLPFRCGEARLVRDVSEEQILKAIKGRCD